MSFILEGRPSDSPYVDSVWRTQTETAGSFISAADTHFGLVVVNYNGQTTITLRGPETKATPAEFPAGADFFGVIFKMGTFMPHLPPGSLMDRQDSVLPTANRTSFWLYGATWQFPEFENVDTFINRLVRQELLTYDPLVSDVLQGCLPDLSIRTVQHRFVHATGLTHKTIQQIGRARQAAALLGRGTSIADTVYAAGYFDQPHLTRSLKRYMGQTPAQIARS